MDATTFRRQPLSFFFANGPKLEKTMIDENECDSGKFERIRANREMEKERCKHAPVEFVRTQNGAARADERRADVERDRKRNGSNKSGEMKRQSDEHGNGSTGFFFCVRYLRSSDDELKGLTRTESKCGTNTAAAWLFESTQAVRIRAKVTRKRNLRNNLRSAQTGGSERASARQDLTLLVAIPIGCDSHVWTAAKGVIKASHDRSIVAQTKMKVNVRHQQKQTHDHRARWRQTIGNKVKLSLEQN